MSYYLVYFSELVIFVLRTLIEGRFDKRRTQRNFFDDDAAAARQNKKSGVHEEHHEREK